MTRETEKTNPFLPHDLITQILLRLPAKSLIRFRCVCKSWFSLISDPNFATLHFELGYARTERLVLFVEEDPEVKSIDIINAPSLFDDSASVVLKQLSFLLPFPFHFIKIIGSCRGLVLFDYFPYFFLWNPTTGVYKRLPPPSFYNFDADLNEDDPYLQGFGYDPLTDDYLVILVYYDLSELGYIVNRVEFFSFKANEWKEMEAPCFPYATSCRYFDPRAGLFFNGAIHWIAYRYDLDEVVILVFDLMERSFSEITLPDQFDCNPDFSKLWIFGGFLSVYAPPVPGIENVEGGIWVMEKYKVQTSWIKCHKLIRPDAFHMGFISPICCTKTGDTIVTNGRGLLKFNDKGELQEYRPYCDNSIGCDVDMYTESLLSLPSDSQQAES